MNHMKIKHCPPILTSKDGFSLVEMAIVLVVIALITGSIMSVGVSQIDAAQKAQTLNKMKAIEQALAGYLRINGRIPCPASSTLPIGNADFGIEYCTGTSSVGSGNTLVVQGAVPVVTLQLPNDFMFDGWGNRFTFVITQAFAGSGSNYGTPTTTYYFGNSSAGQITVRDASGGSRTSQAVYVLISHGANGAGAWIKGGGGQQPVSTNTDEANNSQSTALGNFDQIFVQEETGEVFDDLVSYKMTWQLIREAGGVISDPVCTTAASVLNQSISCGSSPGSPNCSNYLQLLAAQVNKWCIQQ